MYTLIFNKKNTFDVQRDVCYYFLSKYCCHGSHMYSKASNVLEYNYAVRVPSNVLEWYPMFSMFSKTKIMKKPILFVIFVSVW